MTNGISGYSDVAAAQAAEAAAQQTPKEGVIEGDYTKSGTIIDFSSNKIANSSSTEEDLSNKANQEILGILNGTDIVECANAEESNKQDTGKNNKQDPESSPAPDSPDNQKKDPLQEWLKKSDEEIMNSDLSDSSKKLLLEIRSNYDSEGTVIGSN